jgi:ATP-binding cassette subfamily F protein 3
MFTQHHIDQLELELTALQQLSKAFPNFPEEKYRAHLSSFGIVGKMALQSIFSLSGGQKSRVAFAISAWTEPHIMILDEPTNHLDLDAVNALI